MKELKISFDNIMDHHFDNRNVFEEIVKHINSITPFIGAGLSAFTYPGWKEFLKGITSKIRNTTDKQRILKLLDKCEFEEAASELKKIRGTVNFETDISLAFDAAKIFEFSIEKKLYKQAVYLLPKLFRSLVITTNFEMVIEHVYGKNGLPFCNNIGHPGHTEMLYRALRENRQTLYKFHGDISEIGKLVLTKESYDSNYSPESSLVEELRRCFEQKMLLFLGCSLENDRTLELLNRIIGNGITNYAILSCEERELDKKSRELGDRRIRTIFYRSGEYESVRIILERLLERINKDEYKLLPYYENTPKDRTTTPFEYDSDTVSFFGRRDELKRLKEFCMSNHTEPVKWWAITGEGGSGKSRLAYEFQNHMAEMHWNIIENKQHDFTQLKSLSKSPARKTLFILDYVQGNSKEIGEWIKQLYTCPGTIIIRIILIERSGKAIDESPWARQISAAGSSTIRAACYDSDFLYLNPLDQQDIKNIMLDYAKYCGDTQLNEWKATELYLHLNKIDEALCRPLYALFLVDAWIRKENPFKWDKSQTLDYVVHKEKERAEKSLENQIGRSDIRLNNAFFRIKAMATVMEGLSIPQQALEYFADDWETIEQKADRFEDAKDMLFRSGLIEKGSNYEFKLQPLKPDLIGEYYVLRLLIEETRKERIIKLIELSWKKPVQAFSFFSRLFQDYYDIFKENEKLIEMLIKPVLYMDDKTQHKIYSMFLVSVTASSEKKVQVIATEMLRVLAGKCKDNEEVIAELAKGLYNLSYNQNSEGAKQIVDELCNLAKEHPSNKEVIAATAKGLYNLSYKQDAEVNRQMGKKKSARNYTAKLTVEELRNLAREHTDNEEVIVEFARGLCILVPFTLDEEDTIKDAVDAILELGDLAEEHVSNEEVIAEVAWGLLKLTNAREFVLSAVEGLRSLAEVHTGNEKVLAMLAMGLCNLCDMQDEESTKQTVEELRNWVKEHGGNDKVMAEFAKGLNVTLYPMWYALPSKSYRYCLNQLV